MSSRSSGARAIWRAADSDSVVDQGQFGPAGSEQDAAIAARQVYALLRG
jgi:hypothetical protein